MNAARASALLGSAQLYYKLAGFVSFAVAARFLPAAALGDLFTAIAFASAIVASIGLGMPPLVMRRVARAPESAGGEVSRILGLRLATLPLFVGVVAIAGAALGVPSWPLWAAAAIVVGGEDAYLSIGAVFLGLSRPRINVSIGVAVQTASTLGAVALMVSTRSIEGLAGAQIARAAAMLLVGALVSRRLFGDVRPRLEPAVLHGVLPFATAAALRAITDQADSVLVGVLLPAEQMACYTLALRTLAATTFIPHAVSAAVFPAVGTRGLAAQGLVIRGLGALVVIGLLVTGAMAIAPGLLAKVLFGDLLGAGVAPLLSVFAPLAPLWFAQIFLTSMLQAAGKERAAVAILATGAALGVALAAAGTIGFGARGAVAARAAVALVQCLLAVIALGRGARETR